MIGDQDGLSLPPSVVVTPTGLRDDVRGVEVPLNEAGRLVVQSASPICAAASLVARYGLDERRALVDARSFCAELNDRLLLNVRVRGGGAAWVARWLLAAARGLPLGAVPALPARRHGLDTASRAAGVANSARALATTSSALGAGAAAATAIFLSAVGVASLALAVTAGVTVATGLVLHELGHLLALRNVRACLVTRGLRASVLHRRLDPRRDALVAAAGPAAGALPMLVALAVLLVNGSPEAATATSLFSLQLLGCTVVTRDGRTLCAAW
jgi:hypothetical protein